MHGSRNKIPSKIARLYIYDVKFRTLLGAPYIYDISRLMVKFHFLYLRCTRVHNWVAQIGKWAESCLKGPCNHSLLQNMSMIYIIDVCIPSCPGKHFRLKTDLAYGFLFIWWIYNNVLGFTVLKTTRVTAIIEKIQQCLIWITWEVIT
jgi:hypothetical protein